MFPFVKKKIKKDEIKILRHFRNVSVYGKAVDSYVVSYFDRASTRQVGALYCILLTFKYLRIKFQFP